MWHYLDNSGNFICSLAREGVSSQECSLDTQPSAPLKSNPTQDPSCLLDSETAFSPASPSGMTLPPLTENHGEEGLMSSAEDSPAKTFQQPAKEKDSAENDLDYGPTWPGSLAKWNQHTSSWRTAQCSLFGGLTEFLETFPRWGMMHDGELWEEQRPNWLNQETGYGFLPTLRRSGRDSAFKAYIREDYHGNMEEFLGRIGFSGWICPAFSEAVMEWPTGWTDIAPLAMDKFQQWQHSHTES